MQKPRLTTRGIFEALRGLLSQTLASACSRTRPVGGLPSTHFNCWIILSCTRNPASSRSPPAAKVTAVELSCCDSQDSCSPRIHERASAAANRGMDSNHKKVRAVDTCDFSMVVSPVAGSSSLSAADTCLLVICAWVLVEPGCGFQPNAERPKAPKSNADSSHEMNCAVSYSEHDASVPASSLGSQT